MFLPIYFLGTALETYFELRPTKRQSFAAWQAIMAANYLADVSLPEEEKDLMAIIENGIESV